jgi:hypothetical protein
VQPYLAAFFYAILFDQNVGIAKDPERQREIDASVLALIDAVFIRIPLEIHRVYLRCITNGSNFKPSVGNRHISCRRPSSLTNGKIQGFGFRIAKAAGIYLKFIMQR